MKLSIDQLQQLIQSTYIDHRGKNLYGKCPKCGHDEFGISLNEGHAFGCFRKSKCGFSGNIHTLLHFLGRYHEFVKKRDVDSLGKIPNKLVDVDVQEPIDLTLSIVKPPLLWNRVHDDDYLRERGWTDEQFKLFEAGVSPVKKDYIIILVRMSGKIVGYISRSKKSKEWIDSYNQKQKDKGGKLVFLRYDNSSTDFSKCLFGYDEIIEGETTDVILVEGIFSKTKTDINLGLYETSRLKCCATFGAKLSVEQMELLKLKKVETVWLWFESDVLQKVKEVAIKASMYFNVRVSYIDKIDPGDMNSDQAFAALENSTNYLDFNLNYIQWNPVK